jgi:ABC-type Fe2+-enterobactin transport system substrate-binding protein
MPDLILISATGGDSALALYDQLSAIAPTLIINYDDKSWQELLTQLGRSPDRKNRPQSALPHLINSSRR